MLKRVLSLSKGEDNAQKRFDRHGSKSDEFEQEADGENEKSDEISAELSQQLELLQKPPHQRSIDDLMKLISSVSQAKFFQDLDPTVRVQTCRALQLEQFGPGEMIFAEGDPGDQLYIILEGTVGVFVKEVSMDELSISRCASAMGNSRSTTPMGPGRRDSDLSSTRRDSELQTWSRRQSAATVEESAEEEPQLTQAQVDKLSFALGAMFGGRSRSASSVSKMDTVKEIGAASEQNTAATSTGATEAKNETGNTMSDRRQSNLHTVNEDFEVPLKKALEGLEDLQKVQEDDSDSSSSSDSSEEEKVVARRDSLITKHSAKVLMQMRGSWKEDGCRARRLTLGRSALEDDPDEEELEMEKEKFKKAAARRQSVPVRPVVSKDPRRKSMFRGAGERRKTIGVVTIANVDQKKDFAADKEPTAFRATPSVATFNRLSDPAVARLSAPTIEGLLSGPSTELPERTASSMSHFTHRNSMSMRRVSFHSSDIQVHSQADAAVQNLKECLNQSRYLENDTASWLESSRVTAAKTPVDEDYWSGEAEEEDESEEDEEDEEYDVFPEEDSEEDDADDWPEFQNLPGIDEEDHVLKPSASICSDVAGTESTRDGDGVFSGQESSDDESEDDQEEEHREQPEEKPSAGRRTSTFFKAGQEVEQPEEKPIAGGRRKSAFCKADLEREPEQPEGKPDAGKRRRSTFFQAGLEEEEEEEEPKKAKEQQVAGRRRSTFFQAGLKEEEEEPEKPKEKQIAGRRRSTFFKAGCEEEHEETPPQSRRRSTFFQLDHEDEHEGEKHDDDKEHESEDEDDNAEKEKVLSVKEVAQQMLPRRSILSSGDPLQIQSRRNTVRMTICESSETLSFNVQAGEHDDPADALADGTTSPDPNDSAVTSAASSAVPSRKQSVVPTMVQSVAACPVIQIARRASVTNRKMSKTPMGRPSGGARDRWSLMRRVAIADQRFQRRSKPSMQRRVSAFSAGVLSKVVEVAVLGKGAVFGEVALNSNQPRSATIKTKTTTYVATLSREDYMSILHDAVKGQQQERYNLLKSLPLTKGMAESALHRLAALLQPRTLQRRESVYEYGAPVLQVFIAISGQFSVCCPAEEVDKEGPRAPVLPQPAKGSSKLRLSVKQKEQQQDSTFITTAQFVGPAVFGLSGFLRGERCYRNKVVCQSAGGSIYGILAKELVHYLARDVRKNMETVAQVQEMFHANRVRVLKPLTCEGARKCHQHLRRKSETSSVIQRLKLARGDIAPPSSVYSPEGRLQAIKNAFKPREDADESAVADQQLPPLRVPSKGNSEIEAEPPLSLQPIWCMEVLQSQHELRVSKQDQSNDTTRYAIADIRHLLQTPEKDQGNDAPWCAMPVVNHLVRAPEKNQENDAPRSASADGDFHIADPVAQFQRLAESAHERASRLKMAFDRRVFHRQRPRMQPAGHGGTSVIPSKKRLDDIAPSPVSDKSPLKPLKRLATSKWLEKRVQALTSGQDGQRVSQEPAPGHPSRSVEGLKSPSVQAKSVSPESEVLKDKYVETPPTTAGTERPARRLGDDYDLAPVRSPTCQDTQGLFSDGLLDSFAPHAGAGTPRAPSQASRSEVSLSAVPGRPATSCQRKRPVLDLQNVYRPAQKPRSLATTAPKQLGSLKESLSKSCVASTRGGRAGEKAWQSVVC